MCAQGYYDPLNLAGADFWGMGNEATIGWLRQAEIKHGRVAMMGFVGFVVQACGVHWPWKISTTMDFATVSAAGSCAARPRRAPPRRLPLPLVAAGERLRLVCA